MTVTKSRSGLGRGLGDLIHRTDPELEPQRPEPLAVEPPEGSYYAELPVDSIRPNPKQPRQVFEEDSLDELVESIREVGLLQPIVARPLGNDHYELVMGERRLRASQQAGLATIPTIVRPTAGPLGWLWPPSSDPANPLTPMLMRKSAEKLSQRTDIDVYRGRYLWENLQRIVTFNDRGPHVVLHGDSHPGNTFFRNGVAGLLDWQVVRRGHPSRDLAYTLVLGMTPEDRREHQQELLDVYRDALPANGGPQLDRDELFNRYRQGMVYSFVSALTTAGLGGMQTENIALEGLRRSVAAMEDLATVASLSAEMSSQL